MVFKKSLHPCAWDKSSLSIGRVNSITIALFTDLKVLFIYSHIQVFMSVTRNTFIEHFFIAIGFTVDQC